MKSINKFASERALQILSFQRIKYIDGIYSSFFGKLLKKNETSKDNKESEAILECILDLLPLEYIKIANFESNKSLIEFGDVLTLNLEIRRYKSLEENFYGFSTWFKFEDDEVLKISKENLNYINDKLISSVLIYDKNKYMMMTGCTVSENELDKNFTNLAATLTLDLIREIISINYADSAPDSHSSKYLNYVKTIDIEICDNTPSWNYKSIASAFGEYKKEVERNDAEDFVLSEFDGNGINIIFPLKTNDGEVKAGRFVININESDRDILSVIYIDDYNFSEEEINELLYNLNNFNRDEFHLTTKWISGRWIKIPSNDKYKLLYKSFYHIRYSRYLDLKELIKGFISEVVISNEKIRTSNEFYHLTKGISLDV